MTKKTGPQEASLPAIDWNLCVRVANHKEDVAQEILEMILKQLPADLEDIRQARASANEAEFLRLVHRLHGALCYSGLPRLKNAVAKLETSLKLNDADTARVMALSSSVEAEAQTVLESELPR